MKNKISHIRKPITYFVINEYTTTCTDSYVKNKCCVMRPVCQPVSVCMSPLQFSPHCWLVVMGERRVMYKYIASPQQALCSTPLWWQMATGHLSQDPSRTARQVGRRGSVVSIGTCRQATFLKKAISNFKHSVINRKPFKTASYG